MEVNTHCECGLCVALRSSAPTPPRGEPMPKTIEHYKANALRDQELILEQRDEISSLSMKNNSLKQKLNKGKS